MRQKYEIQKSQFPNLYDIWEILYKGETEAEIVSSGKIGYSLNNIEDAEKIIEHFNNIDFEKLLKFNNLEMNEIFRSIISDKTYTQ